MLITGKNIYRTGVRNHNNKISINKNTYIFDFYAGLVIFHPLFQYSEDNEMRFVDIMAFEREPKMEPVIEDMKK